MSNFCPNCGKPVKSTDNVCGNCGTPLKNKQSNINGKAASQSIRSQQPYKKKHSAYKWVIGVAGVVILAGGGYLIHQNSASTNNSTAMKKTANSTSSKKSDSAQSENSTTNSSDDQSSTEENDNQEDTTSSNDQESTTSSNQQENNDEGETLADIGPKTAASSILLLGGKKNAAWKNFLSADHLEVNVDQNTSDSDNDNYSEPGTGVAYTFTNNGANSGVILEYRISRDESTVYCYEQSAKDAYNRHVTPFATLSAKEIHQIKDSAKVKSLVNKMEVKVD